MKVLIIDNFDSFAFNLYQAVGELGASPQVVRNDEIDLAEVRVQNPDRIILSPGPGHPEDRHRLGVSNDIIDQMTETPILGVCLGHQGIVHRLGGRVVRAKEARHGKTSRIHHSGRGLFRELPESFEAMRYHSLVVSNDSLPDCLEVSARCDDGQIMGVHHRHRPIDGVQFHPESIGTSVGSKLLQNFLDA